MQSDLLAAQLWKRLVKIVASILTTIKLSHLTRRHHEEFEKTIGVIEITV